jgi:sialidase-1
LFPHECIHGPACIFRKNLAPLPRQQGGDSNASAPLELTPSIRWLLFRNGLAEAESFFVLQRAVTRAKGTALSTTAQGRRRLQQAEAALAAVASCVWDLPIDSTDAKTKRRTWNQAYSTNVTQLRAVVYDVGEAIEGLQATQTRSAAVDGAMLPPAAPRSRIDSQKLIWQTLEENPGLPTYDIFVSPQLVMTKNGSILSFCGARKCDPGRMGCEDNTGRHDVIVKRSDDGGATFGNAALVHSESIGNTTQVIGNPACVLDERTGRLHIFMCRNNSHVLLSYSDNNGDSWAPPKDVTSMVKRQDWGWYATTFSGIQLKRQTDAKKNGRLVVCCDHQDHYDFKNNGDESFSHSHLLWSDDGDTWHIGGGADRLTNECTVAELANGTLVMNSRDYLGQSAHTTHRAISWSTDGGETLSHVFRAPTLPDPVVEGAMTTDATGNTLVFTHPNSETQRSHMTVFTSLDGGASWESRLMLDAAKGGGYSSVILLRNGSFAVQHDFGSTSMHRCSEPPDGHGCGEKFAIITLKTDEQPPPNMATSVLLTDAVAKTGARCLDGTPQRIWVQDAASAANATKFVFRFMGGAWCTSMDSCLGRAYSKGMCYFGSSSLDCFNNGQPALDCSTGKNFSAQMDWRDVPCIDGARWGGGLLMGEPATNPLAHDWNKVEMQYCDGGSFAGDLEAPVEYKGKTLYFRGNRNVDAALDWLVEHKQMDAATHIVVSGESAGGLATYWHLDAFRARFPKAQVLGVPDSGFFLGLPSHPSWPKSLEFIANEMNGTSGLDASCVAAARAAGKDPATSCTLPELAAPHIAAPVFVMNSRYDPALIGISAGLPDAAGEGLRPTPAEVKSINSLGATVLATINATVLRKGQNAAFITACHEHCGQWSTGQVLDWGKNSGPLLGFDDFNVTIDGQTAGEAVVEWFRALQAGGSGAGKLWLQGSAFPCDTCCHGGEKAPAPLRRSAADHGGREDRQEHAGPGLKSDDGDAIAKPGGPSRGLMCVLIGGQQLFNTLVRQSVPTLVGSGRLRGVA